MTHRADQSLPWARWWAGWDTETGAGSTEDLVRYADPAGFFQALEAGRGVRLTDTVARFIEQDVDAGDIETERRGRTNRELRHLRRRLEGCADTPEGDVRLETAVGGAPFHRSDRAAVDDQHTYVAPVARLNVLLEYEVGHRLRA